MEPGLREEQELRKLGGKGAVLVFGSLGVSSLGLWYSQCPRDIHTGLAAEGEGQALSPLMPFIQAKKERREGSILKKWGHSSGLWLRRFSVF